MRITVAALNFFDTLIIAGRYQVKPELPFSPGAEACGVIEALGSGVEAFRVGERVMMHSLAQIALTAPGPLASALTAPSKAASERASG